MTTQKFMGRNQLIDRLAAQVGNRDTAIGILQKRGHLKADGKTLTAEGQKRNMMTAEERAIDRATKRTGEAAKNFKYDPKTNRATFRKK
jgi:GTP-dependent phosphoenolpyruvate carboxykinase